MRTNIDEGAINPHTIRKIRTEVILRRRGDVSGNVLCRGKRNAEEGEKAEENNKRKDVRHKARHGDEDKEKMERRNNGN